MENENDLSTVPTIPVPPPTTSNAPLGRATTQTPDPLPVSHPIVPRASDDSEKRKMCQCGASLAEHSRVPPFNSQKTNCQNFSLVVGDSPQGPIAGYGRPEDKYCVCGATMVAHDKESPHGHEETGCQRFTLLRA